MSTRDEYVESLKKQLDAWNAEIARWEVKASSAKDEMKKRYGVELEKLAARRETIRYDLKLLEGASLTAWDELRSGADEAWDRMRDAMKEARSHFASSQPPQAQATNARRTSPL